MLRYAILLLAGVVPAMGTTPAHSRTAPLNERMLGRWDITITTPDGPRPSWLEVERSGRDAIIGRFVGVVGSARPISVRFLRAATSAISRSPSSAARLPFIFQLPTM